MGVRGVLYKKIHKSKRGNPNQRKNPYDQDKKKIRGKQKNKEIISKEFV